MARKETPQSFIEAVKSKSKEVIFSNLVSKKGEKILFHPPPPPPLPISLCCWCALNAVSLFPSPVCSSEMTIYILEKPVLGGTRRLLAADVFMFLQNASGKVCSHFDTSSLGSFVVKVICSGASWGWEKFTS